MQRSTPYAARTLSINETGAQPRFGRGDDESEERALKQKLALEIAAILKEKRLTQVRAGILLDLKQPDVSAIVTGRIEKFSIGRLLRCLDRLDYRAHFEVRPKLPAERTIPWEPE